MRPPRSNERGASYDRTAQADAAAQGVRTAWTTIAGAYPAEIAARTDATLEASASGTYADVSAVELAEVHYLMALRAAALERHAVLERLQLELEAKKPRTAKAREQRDDRVASLERRARAKLADVLAITRVLAGKLRHLRLVVDKTGGANDEERREVTLPEYLASPPEYVDTLDLLAPVVDPHGKP